MNNEIYENKNNENKEVKKNEIEYSLKLGKFNPIKKSPNLFISNLEFRIKNYFYELDSDDFKLDTK